MQQRWVTRHSSSEANSQPLCYLAFPKAIQSKGPVFTAVWIHVTWFLHFHRSMAFCFFYACFFPSQPDLELHEARVKIWYALKFPVHSQGIYRLTLTVLHYRHSSFSKEKAWVQEVKIELDEWTAVFWQTAFSSHKHSSPRVTFTHSLTSRGSHGSRAWWLRSMV